MDKAKELKNHAIDFVMWYDQAKPDDRFPYKFVYKQWLDELEQNQEKPDINNPKFWEHVGQSDTWLNESKYNKALKEWESNQEDK